MSQLNPEKIKEDFPVLEHVIYLDNAATTLSPRPVVEAQAQAEYNYRANVGRGVHRLGRMATHKFEESREVLKKFFGGENGVLAFVRNTTEGINIVANGLDWNKNDRVVVHVQEHHSNLLPWFRLEDSKRIAGVDIINGTNGTVNPEDIEAMITKDTKLVAVAHASNVFGTIAPIKEIAKICAEHEVLLSVDGAQTAPHLPINLKDIGCDYFSFSGHKMLGPMGIGGLWIKDGSPKPTPAYAGGGMVSTVFDKKFTTVGSAGQYEAGTPNVIGAVGLAKAAEYLSNIGMKNVAAHSESLAKRMIKSLSEINGVNVALSDAEGLRLTGAVSFTVDGVHPHEVAYFLDEAAAIMVRSGEHCCQPLMKKIAPSGGGTVRASAYCYNTEDDVDMLAATVEEIAGMVK